MKQNNLHKTVSADSGQTLRTIFNLWPYMWPSDRPDLKIRVLWALFYLVLSKLILISVPYFFKYATNALNIDYTPPNWLPAVFAAPVIMVLSCLFDFIWREEQVVCRVLLNAAQRE